MVLPRPGWPITSCILLLTRPVLRLTAAPLPPKQRWIKRDDVQKPSPMGPTGVTLLTDHACMDPQHPNLMATFKAAEGIIHTHFKGS